MSDPYGLGLTPEHLLGKPCFHVGMNLIVQKMSDDGKVVGVFQCSQGTPLLHGSDKIHQLILGDVFVRPRLICESDQFAGRGVSSLLRDGFTENSVEIWLKGLRFTRE